MAVELATGYVSLTVSARGIGQDMARQLAPVTSIADREGQRAGQSLAQSLTSKFGSAVSSIGKTLSTALTGAATAGAGLAAVFGGTALAKGLSRLTTIQNATSALTVTLGSAAAAGDLVNQILGVVKGTPFNLDQFANAGKNLVAFNVPAAKVPGLLTAIGEAAASSGKGAQAVDQLVDAFGKISAQGKVSLDDVWSISSSGVPALQILANKFGVTTDAMRDMISKGSVPAGEAIDALTDGIVNGTDGIAGATVKLGGSMANLRETLTGALGGAQAAIARFGAAFLGPFIGPITKGLQSATALLDGFAPKVKAFAESIAGSAGFARFTAFVSDLPNRLEPVLGFFQKLGPALGPIVGLLASIASTNLSNLLGPLGGLIPVLGPVAGIIGGLVVASPELRGAFAGLVKAVVPLVTSIGKGLAPALASISRLVGTVAAAFVGPLGQAVKSLTPAISKVARLVGGTLSKALDQLGPPLAAVVAALSGALLEAVQALAPILPPLATAFADVATAVAGSLSGALQNLAPVLPDLVSSLGKVAAIVGRDLADALVALTPAIPPLAQLVAIGADLIAKVPPDVLAKIVEAYLLFRGVNAVTGKVQEFAGAVKLLADTPLGNIAGNLATKLGDLLKIGTQRVLLKLEADVSADLAAGAGEGLLARLRALVAAKLGVQGSGLTAEGLLGQVAMKVAILVTAEIALEKITGTDPFGFGKWRKAVEKDASKAIDLKLLVNWDDNALLQSAGDLVDGIIDGVKNFGKSAWDGLKSVFFDGITGAFKSALGIASPSTVMAALATEIPAGILQGILSGLGTLANLALNFLGVGVSIISGLLSGAASALGGVASFFGGLAGQVIGWIGDLASTLLPKGLDLLTGLFNGMVSGVTAVAGFLGGLASSVVTWVGDAASWLIDKGVQVLRGLGAGIIAGAGEVKDWLGGMAGRVANWVGDAASWLVDAGSRVISGLLSGMKSGIGAVQDWLGGLADKFLKWKPISTDHLILRPAGLAIMRGLNESLRDGLGDIRKTLNDTTDLLASTPLQFPAPALSTFTVAPAALAGAASPDSADRPSVVITGNNFQANDPVEQAQVLVDEIAWATLTGGFG